MAQEFARTFNIQWMSLPQDIMEQEHHDHLTSTPLLHT